MFLYGFCVSSVKRFVRMGGPVVILEQEYEENNEARQRASKMEGLKKKFFGTIRGFSITCAVSLVGLRIVCSACGIYKGN